MINTMNKNLSILLLFLCPFATIYAQLLTNDGWHNLNLDREWQTYLYRSKDDLYLLRQKYFRDTISVDEMKVAFRNNKDTTLSSSPYQGHDSIFTYQGNLLCLVRPKAKGLQLNRIYWNRNRTRDEAKLLDGDLVFLRYPQHYMGFVVSPQPLMETYDKGKMIGREGAGVGGDDFFCTAQFAIGFLDGTWNGHLGSGTIMLGTLIGKDEPPRPNRLERTFSVLLYEKNGAPAGYSIELLLPDKPDSETLRDFHWMKQYVEKLPSGTFRPYYTSDLRILTSRYFRVTVNKCGWILEDYLDINKKRR